MAHINVATANFYIQIINFCKDAQMSYFINSLKTLVFILLSTSLSTHAANKKVGIIVPIEHEAMIQIVSGIKESLPNTGFEVIVKNAHGDPNIMLALIKQMKDGDIDLIIPIGTSASQMTISHIKDKPVVCAAAIIDDKNHPLAASLNDEIPIAVSLIKLPKLRNISVIYSASEKIAPEIEELKAYARTSGIKLHLAMIQNLSDMPAAVQSSPPDIQAFLVLKDHLVVSGINILMQEANKRGIPLIASDEGSVESGATIAIGVKEKQIGIVAGLMAKDILNGTKPSDIGHKTMDELILFVNDASILKQNVLTQKDLQDIGMNMLRINTNSLTKEAISNKLVVD